MAAAFTLEQLLDYYLQARDKEAEISKRHTEELKPVRALMDQIETAFLTRMQADGTTSFKSDKGTAYQTTHTSVTVADRNAFFDWALENDHDGMIDVRANKTAVKEYLEATKAAPPGLTIRSIVAVNVRKS